MADADRTTHDGGQGAGDWLARFHDGDRAIFAECYRDHFDTVFRAVGSVLRGADRETVVHDVFLSLLESEDRRRSFRGGRLGGWLATIARHRAIDFARRHGRERSVEPDDARAMAGRDAATDEPPRSAHDEVESAELRSLVERFRRERLPAKWAPVFEARFLRQMSQREAALSLGLRRTTLAYQEARVRALLRRFVLRGESA